MLVELLLLYVHVDGYDAQLVLVLLLLVLFVHMYDCLRTIANWHKMYVHQLFRLLHVYYYFYSIELIRLYVVPFFFFFFCFFLRDFVLCVSLILLLNVSELGLELLLEFWLNCQLSAIAKRAIAFNLYMQILITIRVITTIILVKDSMRLHTLCNQNKWWSVHFVSQLSNSKPLMLIGSVPKLNPWNWLPSVFVSNVTIIIIIIINQIVIIVVTVLVGGSLLLPSPLLLPVAALHACSPYFLWTNPSD